MATEDLEELSSKMWQAILDLDVVADNYYLMSDTTKSGILKEQVGELKRLKRELDEHVDGKDE